MQILGVFTRVFEDGQMDLGRALIVSLIGFATVLAVLCFLAVFVYCMGKVFTAITANKTRKTAAPAAAAPAPAPVKSEVTLIDVSEKDAAVIMAIISNKTDIPLEKLKFNYIKPVEDK